MKNMGAGVDASTPREKKEEVGEEEYTLIFYTTQHFAVFRYYCNSETYLCETRKSIVLWWISPEEKEKLLAFEMKKKEKYTGLKVYDGTTMEGL